MRIVHTTTPATRMLYSHEADQMDIFRHGSFALARSITSEICGTAARTTNETGSLNRMRSHQLYIDGKWVAPHSGETFLSVNPFTSEPWAQIAQADEVDVK